LSKKPFFKRRVLIAAIVAVLVVSSLTVSYAQRGNRGGNGTLNLPQPNVNAVLSHLGIPNPLNWTRDVLGLGFAQNFQGGQQLVQNLIQNWLDVLLPGKKDRAAQLNTAQMDRARNYGSGINAQNIDEYQLNTELNEIEQVSGGISETACQIATGITGSSGSGGGSNGGAGGGNGTGQGGLSSGFQISGAITRALGEQMNKVGLNSEGSPSEFGPTSDYGERYKIYSQHFCDPSMNGGQAGCNPQGPQLPNADISVESFLLKDTIDMDKMEEKLATEAILRNLVVPNVGQPISEQAFGGYGGKNGMLKKRQLLALRNMPVAAVSNIIGRRTAIPDSNVSDTIRPIRERAGVEPTQISDKASFNEIMLALTKERFYDSNYFLTVSQSTLDQVAQEQMGIDVLTQITLRQIHTLQEQINGLMAARASIKHNNDSYSNASLRYGGVSGTSSP